MHHTSITTKYFILSLTFASNVAFSAVPTQFKATDLGVPSGYDSAMASGINNHGQVIGTVSVFGQPVNQAVLWENGVVNPLGLFGGTNSYGNGISDTGIAVGGLYRQPNWLQQYPPAAFYYTPDQSGILQPVDMWGGFAVDVNSAGQMLGANSFWQSISSTPTSLGSVTGVKLNANGVAAGYIYSTGSQGTGYQAVTWNNGIVTKLGYFSLGCGDGRCNNNSVPSDINDFGQVVGGGDPYAWKSGVGPQRKAFLWDDGIMTDIGSIGQGSTALAINNSAIVVGRTGYKIPTGASDQAFIWSSETGMLALTDLITNKEDWRYFLMATDINESNQIVGYGVKQDGQYRAFRLDPVQGVPEPSTIALIIFGLFALSQANTSKSKRPS